MIRLPDFLDTRCVYFQACGRLSQHATAAEADLVALRSIKTGRFYLRFLAGGGAKGDHLHVDLARTRIFPPARRPEVNSKASGILHLLEAHKGQPLRLLILGRYILDATEDKLISGPLFANIRSASPTIDKATAEVAGASLIIRNDDYIDFIQWDIFGKEALVDIYGHCTTEVSDDYLVDAFALMQRAFIAYILGEATQ